MSLSSILQSLPDLFSSGKNVVESGIWAGLGVCATAGFRWLTAKDKTNAKSDQVFTGNLVTRCAYLEREVDRLRHEAEVREELHDREVAYRRHEAGNAKMCFNYLMMLVKRITDPPEALKSIISDIDSMRSDLMKREDQERESLEEFERTMKQRSDS